MFGAIHSWLHLLPSLDNIVIHYLTQYLVPCFNFKCFYGAALTVFCISYGAAYSIVMFTCSTSETVVCCMLQPIHCSLMTQAEGEGKVVFLCSYLIVLCFCRVFHF